MHYSCLDYFDNIPYPPRRLTVLWHFLPIRCLLISKVGTGSKREIMSHDTIFFCSKDARLPVQLQRAMAAEAEAAREARAKACCCVATLDTEHHSTYMLSFFLPLSFRLLLQRANKKPRELSKRPRRSFPSRRRPSSSVTCRYDIRTDEKKKGWGIAGLLQICSYQVYLDNEGDSSNIQLIN